MASPFTPPTIPGAQGYPLGLTGATAATRYVGATTSGAPASGTFAVGDFVIARDGSVYICTVAGSPGTWATVGGGIPATILDAKGDIIAASAADTAARLAVGTDGNVPIADANSAVGILWGTSPLSVPGYTTGSWYTTPLIQGGGAGAFTLQDLFFVPIWISRRKAFDRIGTNVNTGVPTAVQRLGLYADTGSAVPGALVVDAGTVDCSTSGDKEITIAVTLNPGLYWLASVSQTAQGVMARDIGISVMPFKTTIGTASASWKRTSVSGALPDPGAPNDTAALVNTPRTMLRAA